MVIEIETGSETMASKVHPAYFKIKPMLLCFFPLTSVLLLMKGRSVHSVKQFT